MIRIEALNVREHMIDFLILWNKIKIMQSLC